MNQDLLMITNEGTIIRTPAKGIPYYGRNASGVIAMRLAEGAKIVNFALADSVEEKEDDLQADDGGGEESEDGGPAFEAEVTDGGDGFVTEMDLGPETDEEDAEEDTEAEEIPDEENDE